MAYAGPASRGKRFPASGALAATTSAAESRSPTGTNITRSPLVRTRRPEREWDGMTVFAAGIALGLAIGVGTALLFAPQAGEETRRALVRRARRAGGRSRDAWEDLRLEMRRAARQRVRAFKERRRERAERKAADR